MHILHTFKKSFFKFQGHIHLNSKCEASLGYKRFWHPLKKTPKNFHHITYRAESPLLKHVVNIDALVQWKKGMEEEMSWMQIKFILVFPEPGNTSEPLAWEGISEAPLVYPSVPCSRLGHPGRCPLPTWPLNLRCYFGHYLGLSEVRKFDPCQAHCLFWDWTDDSEVKNEYRSHRRPQFGF